MGKIIQIAITGHSNTSMTQSDWTMIALDDNGRLWAMSNQQGWGEIPLPVVREQPDFLGALKKFVAFHDMDQDTIPGAEVQRAYDDAIHAAKAALASATSASTTKDGESC